MSVNLVWTKGHHDVEYSTIWRSDRKHGRKILGVYLDPEVPIMLPKEVRENSYGFSQAQEGRYIYLPYFALTITYSNGNRSSSICILFLRCNVTSTQEWWKYQMTRWLGSLRYIDNAKSVESSHRNSCRLHSAVVTVDIPRAARMGQSPPVSILSARHGFRCW
jgi:hypothetical protein